MIEAILVVLAISIVIILIFVLTHLDPLTEGEIKQLAKKRRMIRIRSYFSFDRREFYANREFKKRMNPTGEFYPLSEDLYEFPSLAAALLKYKKHEWIIIAFEREKQ